eukprot:gene8407-232_t
MKTVTRELSQIETIDFASPTNIYSLFLLNEEILFVSTFSNVYSMRNFQKQKRFLTQMPVQSNIVSICCYQKKKEIMLAVCIIQYFGEQRSTRNYLFLYSIPDISNVSRDKLMTQIDLKYQPLEIQIIDEIIFISGTDKRIHMYIDEKHGYVEMNTFEYYPDLVDLTSSILRFQFHKNFLIFGCQNGYISMIHSDEKKQSLQLDGPCSSILYLDDDNELLVSDSVGRVYLFQNLKKLNQNAILLKNDNNTVYCLEAFNIFSNEKKKNILMGTTKGLLVYSYIKDKYELTLEISFPYPIYSIKCFDINSDGCAEVVVLTMKSLHILRPTLSDILLEKLEL